MRFDFDRDMWNMFDDYDDFEFEDLFKSNNSRNDDYDILGNIRDSLRDRFMPNQDEDNSPRTKSYDFGDDEDTSIDNYILIEFAGSKSYNMTLPCYPDEISDSVSAMWSEQTVIGRSSPIASYTGASFREVSFTLQLHRELTGNPDDIEKLLANLRRAVYPAYLALGYTPAIVTIRIGALNIRGFLRSITYSWRKPIIDKKYQICDVSLQLAELLPDGFDGGASESYLTSSMSPYKKG